MIKTILKFDLDQKDVRIKKILNKEFLELDIYAISDLYPNRNDTCFTVESMEKSLHSCYNKPILGSFDVVTDDFREHNGQDRYDKEFQTEYWDCNGANDEKILGVIRAFTVPGKGEMYCNAAYSDKCKTCKQKKRYEEEFEATYDAWENSWVDGWTTVSAEEEEEFYKKKMKAPYKLYQWGVWTTCRAREKLQQAIDICDITPGADLIYTDTDCVKFIGQIDLSEINKEQIAKSKKSGLYGHNKVH